MCLVAGCEKPVKTRGYCSAHYQRFRTWGNPLTGGRPHGFAMNQVRQALASDTDDCIFWAGAKRPNGYGNIYYGGRYQTVSRLTCKMAHGEPPSARHEAAHSCGKGHLSCINPRHLSWKTPHENNADKITHGTSSRGERRPRVGMSEKSARIAKEMLAEGRPVMVIAESVGAKPAAIYDMRYGKTWAWL